MGDRLGTPSAVVFLPPFSRVQCVPARIDSFLILFAGPRRQPATFGGEALFQSVLSKTKESAKL